MKHLTVFVTLACLLLIVGTVVSTFEVETAAQAAQAGSTPTPESAQPGYTNYSGYYRMRCWPACHTMNIPESLKGRTAQATSTPTPEAKRGYTNYSGYYRMRCWPACHTKNIPESIKKTY
ncbi:MAG: hypothetical protein ACE5I2_09675 [Anaerolineae bacterium]